MNQGNLPLANFPIADLRKSGSTIGKLDTEARLPPSLRFFRVHPQGSFRASIQANN